MTDQKLHLGISTAAFFPLSLEETFAILAPLPWKAIELMPQTPEECMPSFAPRLWEQAGGRFDFCAIHFPQILAPFLYNPYPGAFSFGQEISAGIAELAGALGCRVIVVHAPWKSMSHGAFYEATLKNLRLLCDTGRPYGVTIGLENTPSSPFAGSPQALQAFAKEIDRQNLDYTVDITHAHQMGQDTLDYIENLPSIAHVHASDFDLAGQRRHLLPGKGDVDWTGVMEGLNRKGFHGNFILELLPETLGADPAAGLAESIAFLEPYLENWGRP